MEGEGRGLGLALRAGKIYAGTSPVSGKWRLSAQHPPRSRSGKRRGAWCWLLAAVADLCPLADGLLGELPAQDRFAVVADSCHGQQGGA